MKKNIIVFCLLLLANSSLAATAPEIEVGVNETLQKFYAKVQTGTSLVAQAKGILVFPSVYKVLF